MVDGHNGSRSHSIRRSHHLCSQQVSRCHTRGEFEDHTGEKACRNHSGLESQGRRHQKSKTGVSMTPQKELVSFKVLKKKVTITRHNVKTLTAEFRCRYVWTKFQLFIWPFFSKNCVKMKNFWPRVNWFIDFNMWLNLVQGVLRRWSLNNMCLILKGQIRGNNTFCRTGNVCFSRLRLWNKRKRNTYKGVSTMPPMQGGGASLIFHQIYP